MGKNIKIMHPTYKVMNAKKKKKNQEYVTNIQTYVSIHKTNANNYKRYQ